MGKSFFLKQAKLEVISCCLWSRMPSSQRRRFISPKTANAFGAAGAKSFVALIRVHIQFKLCDVPSLNWPKMDSKKAPTGPCWPVRLWWSRAMLRSLWPNWGLWWPNAYGLWRMVYWFWSPIHRAWNMQWHWWVIPSICHGVFLTLRPHLHWWLRTFSQVKVTFSQDGSQKIFQWPWHILWRQSGTVFFSFVVEGLRPSKVWVMGHRTAPWWNKLFQRSFFNDSIQFQKKDPAATWMMWACWLQIAISHAPPIGPLVRVPCFLHSSSGALSACWCWACGLVKSWPTSLLLLGWPSYQVMICSCDTLDCLLPLHRDGWVPLAAASFWKRIVGQSYLQQKTWMLTGPMSSWIHWNSPVALPSWPLTGIVYHNISWCWMRHGWSFTGVQASSSRCHCHPWHPQSFRWAMRWLIASLYGLRMDSVSVAWHRWSQLHVWQVWCLRCRPCFHETLLRCWPVMSRCGALAMCLVAMKMPKMRNGGVSVSSFSASWSRLYPKSLLAIHRPTSAWGRHPHVMRRWDLIGTGFLEVTFMRKSVSDHVTRDFRLHRTFGHQSRGVRSFGKAHSRRRQKFWGTTWKSSFWHYTSCTKNGNCILCRLVGYHPWQPFFTPWPSGWIWKFLKTIMPRMIPRWRMLPWPRHASEAMESGCGKMLEVGFHSWRSCARPRFRIF